MSTTGRVFCGLARITLRGGRFNKCPLTTMSMRPMVLNSPMSASSKPSTEEAEANNKPIKFSTSKASHRTWKVSRSMGSQYERPWWKVVPISLVVTAFLLWCVFREETDIDVQLEKQLYEQLPGLLTEDDSEKVEK